MKIAVVEPIHERAMALLRARAEVIDWHTGPEEALALADGLIVRQMAITGQMLERAPHLAVIGSHGVGVDNIDLAAARARNITVVNVPFGTANSVAELVFALMLTASRKLVPGLDDIRAGRACRGAPAQRGLELFGKVLGIVGFGHIGARVAEIGRRGFGMSVHAFSRSLDILDAPTGITAHRDLKELLGVSDYICVSVPLTERTRGLVGREELAACKKTAVLVNCARGGVVDEQALYEALMAGRLFGAASDVFVQEPPMPDNPLLSCPNFVPAQHIGANTEEALLRLGMSVAGDVLAVLEGREPRNRYVERVHV